MAISAPPKPPSPPPPPAPPPKPVVFADLWKHYPNDDPCVNPKTGMKAHDNPLLGISRMPSLNPFAPPGSNGWSDLGNSRLVTF
jgi:hypothetical protein